MPSQVCMIPHTHLGRALDSFHVYVDVKLPTLFWFLSLMIPINLLSCTYLGNSRVAIRSFRTWPPLHDVQRSWIYFFRRLSHCTDHRHTRVRLPDLPTAAIAVISAAVAECADGCRTNFLHRLSAW